MSERIIQPFRQASPIWPAGREQEKNLFVGFRAVFEVSVDAKVYLRLAASTIYRAYLNGQFIGHGPARGPHGFYRVDELDLGDQVMVGENLLAIEVAGYNVNSFAYLDQPSFLQAEVVCNDKVIAATGMDFVAMILPERVQQVQRYSFQRPFVEVYRLRSDYAQWRTSEDMDGVECSIQPQKKLLPRGVSYPKFGLIPAVLDVGRGTVARCISNPVPFRERSLTKIGPQLGGFTEDELEVALSRELDHLVNVELESLESKADGAVSLGPDTFHVFDLGTNSTGFIGISVFCQAPVQLLLVFDELMLGGDVSYKRNHSINAVRYDLDAGTYMLETIEPYTLRYLKVISLGGACVIETPYIREYVNPEAHRGRFATNERVFNELFEAGRETFRQNAVDLFMDCPSRERAGWLCDSNFTAKTALVLTGNTSVEHNFIENYLLPDEYPHLPPGMLPMCYPADHNDGKFIAQWPMWFVLQLEEYLDRTQDHETIQAIKPKVSDFLGYLAPYRNADGLLEKIPGWSYVDWTEANKLVQDVNYPTNMLYAAMLDSVARMYDLPKLAEEASAMRQRILEQSYSGEFFVDNARREDGVLRVTDNTTEACQYYAFYFGIATPKTHPKLLRTLVEEFGPQRDVENSYPLVWPTDSFIGYFLRLEILSRYGEVKQLLRDLTGYFKGQVELTGTLWEHDTLYGSCNHGFASYVCHLLYRNALGCDTIDIPHKEIQVCLQDVPLEWCSGIIPIGDDKASLEWWRKEGRIHYRVRVPQGFSLKVTNRTGLPLARHA